MSSAISGTSASSPALTRSVTLLGSGASLRTVAQAEDEPHRALRVREARDLVVDKSSRKGGLDEGCVLDRGARALLTYDPDRAIGLDPALGLFDSDQVALLGRAEEHDVAPPARPAGHDV